MGQNLLERVYEMLPVFAQNAACTYIGRREAAARFNPVFYKKLDELAQSEWWSDSNIQEYQNERLREMITSSYTNVPFYRKIMQDKKLTPQDIRTREDLIKLPILSKEDVRKNADALISSTVNKADMIHRHTSGTTGKSLHFYYTPEAVAFQWAVWWRHRRRFGVEPNTLHANFTGKLVVPASQARPPYWRWNRAQHQALLTMHHMTVDKVKEVVDFLGQQEFVYYSGYPSIIHAMTVSAKEAGVRLANRPRFVFTGAENMLDFQRRDIAAFTGATLTDQYGFSEGCGNASQCQHLVYHEDFEFGILECVDPQITDDGDIRGKIVCTGFACPEFPMIRYEVGDTGVWSQKDSPCACGRHSTVLKRIEGRMDDYVITPEGRRIMRFDYLFKDTDNVREAQVVQYRLEEICVRVVRRQSYSTKDEQFLREEIARWISPALSVTFEYVQEIERERTGKFRAVKSFLPKSAGVN